MRTEFEFGQLVAAGLRVVDADQGSLLLAEPDSKTLRFALVADRNGAAVPSGAAASLVGRTIPIGSGITGMAALTRDVQASSGSEAGGIPFHRVRGDGAPHAVLAAPLLAGETLLGVLTAVRFNRRKTFSPENARAYGIFANLAAGILESANRFPSPDPVRDGTSRLLSDIATFVRDRPDRLAALRGILDALLSLP